ncbi:UNVERIFIED_CONTAM: hypothetical protein FKN15_029027 [Acipenser sinensis]
MLDLSYLSEEEHGYIMGVLIRNVSLKEKDTNRIRQLPADFGDERTQRLVTGSWFEEAKAMCYRDGLNGAELVLASLQRTSRAYQLKPPANPSTSLDWLQNEQRGEAGNARSLPLEDWFDHQEDGHFKSRRSDSSSSSEFSQSYNTNNEPSFTGSTLGLKDQRENHRDSTYSIAGKSASALYQHRSLDLSSPPRFLRSISLQPFRSPPHRNIMEEMYIKMYFLNASQDVLSIGDANKMQWSPPRRAPPTPAPRSAYTTAEDSDLSPNKYGGSLNNEEVVGSPLHIRFPSSTYEMFLEENEQNGVDPVEDTEPSIDTIDNSEEAVTLSKDDTYKLRAYVKKVITSTHMQMDDDIQERGEAILIEETVVDSASYQSHAFVIPNEDLEQNDTEEENSTPSTASASEVPVRVDWSVNSVDSSSLDDQPWVQFALDFSQRSQEFQIYISQCKNLDRVEYKTEYSPLLTCTLELSVWHSSILGRNVCLGDVQVDMSSWDWQNKRLNWYPLNPRICSAIHRSVSSSCSSCNRSAVQSIAVYPAHAPPVTDLQCNPSQCIQLMLL